VEHPSTNNIPKPHAATASVVLFFSLILMVRPSRSNRQGEVPRFADDRVARQRTAEETYVAI